MTDPQLGVLMLIMFVGLIMLGFPIAFTLMAMAVGFAYLAFDGNWEPVMSLTRSTGSRRRCRRGAQASPGIRGFSCNQKLARIIATPAQKASGE